MAEVLTVPSNLVVEGVVKNVQKIAGAKVRESRGEIGVPSTNVKYSDRCRKYPVLTRVSTL